MHSAMEKMSPEKEEQVTPLAAGVAPSYRTRSSVEDRPNLWQVLRPGFYKRHRCCIWVTAAVIIAAIALVAALVAVYKPRDPVMTMNAIAINLTSVAPPNVSFTVVADVSVKNRNPTPFFYDNSLTSLYYHDAFIGQAYGPPGKASGLRTYRSNVTLYVVSSQLLGNSDLLVEVGTGTLEMNSSTNVIGHVMVLGLFRHRVKILWNCTVLSATSNQTVLRQLCKQHVWT